MAGSAGKNLCSKGEGRSGFDHAIKKAATGILISAKNFMLHW